MKHRSHELSTDHVETSAADFLVTRPPKTHVRLPIQTLLKIQVLKPLERVWDRHTRDTVTLRPPEERTWQFRDPGHRA